MKYSALLILSITLSLSLFSQNTIIGKWKPVFIEIDSVMKIDLKTNKAEYAAATEKMFSQKDKAMSKQMMEMMKMMLVGKMKTLIEEFASNNIHTVTDSKTGKKIVTAYKFDVKSKTLIIEDDKSKMKQHFKVEFTKTGFITNGEMPGLSGNNKSKMKIVYEKS